MNPKINIKKKTYLRIQFDLTIEKVCEIIHRKSEILF